MSKPIQPKPVARVLGRGLSSLMAAPIGQGVAQMSGDHGSSTPASDGSRLVDLPIDHIEPSRLQPRKVFEDAQIEELAASIREVGVIQPIVVRPLMSDRYEIISGERRWRASLLANRTKIPALIREEADMAALQMALIENVQRVDLNAIDRAQGYQLYCDTFKVTVDELAKQMGEDRSTIANYLRLLELPAQVLESVRLNRISAGHARSLLSLPTGEQRILFCERCIRDGWSVRELERHVAQFKAGAIAKAMKEPPSPQIKLLEEQIRTHLGLQATIRQKKKGAGELRLAFANLEEFDRLMTLLGVETE